MKEKWRGRSYTDEPLKCHAKGTLQIEETLIRLSEGLVLISRNFVPVAKCCRLVPGASIAFLAPELQGTQKKTQWTVGARRRPVLTQQWRNSLPEVL